METFEFRAEGGVKCGGCNWETSRLYVRANSREDADKLLHNTYGCSGCGMLEWEHPTLWGFYGGDRQNAKPVFGDGVPGACQDYSPNSNDGLEGGGLCGECYAAMLSGGEQGSPCDALLIALRPLVEILDAIPSEADYYMDVRLFAPEWAAIREAYMAASSVKASA